MNVPLKSFSLSSGNFATNWHQTGYTGTRETSKAFSESGKSLDNFNDKLLQYQIRSISSPPDDVRLERELKEILQECSTDNWNGYGAVPIDRKSVKEVCRFIKLMPSVFSYPELCAEPNGDLAMIWRMNGYDVVFGIDAESIITWGGTSPNGHIYGDVKFSERIPIEVLAVLQFIHRN